MSAIPRASAQPMLPTISTIFAALAEVFSVTPRESQGELARQVRNTLAMNGICCVEAPTGTGKTLGYLSGALEYQAHAANPLPVVVATATVGLQEQIIRCDIPRLAEAGVLDPTKVAIAKGRGRYFCPRTAAVLEDKKMRDGQFDMFQPEKHVSDGGTQIALDMLKAWREKTWNGEQDSWPSDLPSCWGSACAASSETCVNRACEHFSTCPYMLSRAKLGHAQVIIANHDLVLADLAQRADEQSTTALPPKRYALIIDEAHNLPEKAISTMEAAAHLSATDWLRKLEAYGEGVRATARVVKAFEKATDCSLDVFGRGSAELVRDLAAFVRRIEEAFPFSVGGTYSWGQGVVQDFVLAEAHTLAFKALELLNALQLTAKVFAEIAEEAIGADKGFAIRYLAETHRFSKQAKDLQSGLARFCAREKFVRWASRHRDGGISLHTRPLEGADVLDKLLWQTDIPVALTSATLQIAGSFERFRLKSGLPATAVTRALPPVFDYSRGLIHMPAMQAAPGESGYEAAVQEKLELMFKLNQAKNAALGMLVLFTSRETMRRIVAGLSPELREVLLTPDQGPLPEIVARHKQRIDAGLRSVLAGLDSMSEGLDLPGKYCSHVVITRLPFAVPGDPVEEARRDAMGADWFEQAYLADMLTTLIQASGRLIRREDDHGVITILDKRFWTKRYATLAKAALPNFQYRNTLHFYFDYMVPTMQLDLTHGVVARPVVSAPVATGEPATKPGLYLAHSRSDAASSRAAAIPATLPPPAQSVAASAQTLPGVEPPEDPLAGLARVNNHPQPTAKPVAVGEQESALAALQRVAPAAPPATADGFQWVDATVPALPFGAPAEAWAERQMAEAVALGLLYSNTSWPSHRPTWQQILRLRPDVLQFAEVLRSHREGRSDDRTAVLSVAHCERTLRRAFAGFGMPGEAELFACLAALDSEVVDILSGLHRWPTLDLLRELSPAATTLSLQLRGQI